MKRPTRRDPLPGRHEERDEDEPRVDRGQVEAGERREHDERTTPTSTGMNARRYITGHRASVSPSTAAAPSAVQRARPSR